MTAIERNQPLDVLDIEIIRHRGYQDAPDKELAVVLGITRPAMEARLKKLRRIFGRCDHLFMHQLATAFGLAPVMPVIYAS